MALINVVFLLLLFFVVTGTIVYQHDRSIVPPTSFELATGKAPADAIFIDADGAVSFRGAKQGPAEIARAVRAGAGRQGESDAVARTIQIVADRRLSARTLLAVIADLRDQGLQSLSIVTVRDHGS
ncbi:MAG TPA: biopolymer transporter ExbD [Aestuariivirgaceae bacterium]|nr:biopolymer transporter ExbD [Aestuariivirgaceae bacterium]